MIRTRNYQFGTSVNCGSSCQSKCIQSVSGPPGPPGAPGIGFFGPVGLPGPPGVSTAALTTVTFQPPPAGGGEITPLAFPTNFIVPFGVTSLVAELWGAGGAGGIAPIIPEITPSGGGGGSGGYIRATIPVTSGQILTLQIGRGGRGTPPGGDVNGEHTRLSTGGITLTAGGGFGAGRILPGSGGVNTVVGLANVLSINGKTGQSGSALNPIDAGQGGGAPFGGEGGFGATLDSPTTEFDADDGQLPGGGGGGNIGAPVPPRNGSGANGLIILTYNVVA